MEVAVTGGAGYIGTEVVRELEAAGHRVRVLDVLAHGQEYLVRDLEAGGAVLALGDVRDADARRHVLEGAEALVHLAAIVGDPACARDPELSQAVNVDASRALFAEAAELDIGRVVFASTCSNYGRMADPDVPIDEAGELRPVSLYARQKVSIERELLEGTNPGLGATCLRFATIYGVAPRMRFDLTVNQFTRDLWAGIDLEVFGQLFWRPYVHVRDAARAVARVLAAPAEAVAGEVFNVGRSSENYRKLDLVEIITAELGRGEVSFVERAEDPRDYKVSFEKISSRLGFETEHLVPDGVREVISALESERFDDPYDARYVN